MSPVSRREFLVAGAAAGAGLVIGFNLRHATSSGGAVFSPNAYLRITPDNKITIVCARSEMGQGVRTALPMILAEELEADWKQIEIEQAGASTLYGDQTTGGSASVRTTWDPMRKAGAAAREMLISAARIDVGSGPRQLRRVEQRCGSHIQQSPPHLWGACDQSGILADSHRCGAEAKQGLQSGWPAPASRRHAFES
jgi:CO/xanthine dehydrogenase Mo-binding subunit